MTGGRPDSSPAFAPNLDALGEWLDHRLGDSQPITNVVPLRGGTQNVLLSFDRADQGLVLRCPRVLGQAGTAMIEREAAVLERLRGTAVPHAALVAVELDAAVIGRPFLVTEWVDGVNPMHELPDAIRADRAVQHRLGLSMVDAIAHLATVDPTPLGPERVARAIGWLERQVPRWTAMLEEHTRAEGSPPFAVDTIEAVRSWLSEHTPTPAPPGILHGDFNFGNVLVDRHDGTVVAVIDWELTTIGDPRLDLGHLLLTWPLPPSLPGEPHLDLPGVPGRTELVEQYETVTGRSCDDVRWFEVLAGYRLSIILEGTRVRAQQGLAESATGERLHRLAVQFLHRAHELVKGEPHD